MNEDVSGIERKIRQTVSRWAMLPAGCTVVAGFSGGADSTTLVHFLSRHKEQYGIQFLAAHVNHGLRGPEADADEKFVVSWCMEHGVACKVLHADVRALAAEKSQGLEECGRNVRYSFFRSLCGENGRIATAHTLSDSTETLLMNLTKGAGPHGLGGIPPVRDNIIRPLIGITRDEVEAYCAFYRLSYVTDSTNADPVFARNRIRRSVVPVLKTMNPNFEEAARKTMELIRCDESYFSAQAERLLEEARTGGGYALVVLRGAPRPVLLRAVTLAVGQVTSARIGYDAVLSVETLILEGKGAVTVPGGIQCAVRGNTLFVTRPCRLPAEPWSVPLELPETRLPDGRVLEIREIAAKGLNFRDKINNLLFNNLINYDTILNTIIRVRNRRGGDVFRPAGRGLTKTVKKLFSEAKVPLPERGRKAVLESEGKLLWVEGFGPSEEAAVTEETRFAAEIKIKEC